MEKIKAWGKKLKQQIFILYYAYKDERVPWFVKVFVACVVAYAFSPIDLIPDFIPVLGFIDDVIILPLGIFFALKLIPEDIKADCEVKANELIQKGKPKNWIAGSLIILIWSAITLWVILKFLTH